MWLPPRKNFIRDSRLTPGGVALLGSSVRINIDRTWPLEEIHVIPYFTNTGTVPTQTGVDGIFKMLKRATLEINDGIQPRKVLDFSGAGLLEYSLQVGANLDRETLEAKRALTASATNRICYRIPLVHPCVYGPLRTQMLLPVHQHPQDPVLQLDFEAAANLYSANAPSLVGCDVVLLRRGMTPSVNKAVMDNGGFIPFDLVESSMTFPLSAAEFRFPVVVPGAYANLLFRHYLGGASVTRADLSVVTVGSETAWRLESGGNVLSEWKNSQLKAVNEFTQSFMDGQAPTFPGHYMLDFLTDGQVDADELGSLLDCNLPAASGLKMEIVASTATVATNASTLYVGGHRYFGDLGRWQAAK